jgi:hypothetical protein
LPADDLTTPRRAVATCGRTVFQLAREATGSSDAAGAWPGAQSPRGDSLDAGAVMRMGRVPHIAPTLRLHESPAYGPDVAVLEGEFPTVATFPDAMPAESQMARFRLFMPATWLTGTGGTDAARTASHGQRHGGRHHRACAIVLPGTGEHGYARRAHYVALPLARHRGMAALVLEGPYYGARMPAGQSGSKLHTVMDLPLLGRATIEEARSLAQWLTDPQFGQDVARVTGAHPAAEPVAVHSVVAAGVSMGGLHSAMTASLLSGSHLEPLGVVSWLGPMSASPVFTLGELGRAVHWRALHDQLPALEPHLVASEAAFAAVPGHAHLGAVATHHHARDVTASLSDVQDSPLRSLLASVGTEDEAGAVGLWQQLQGTAASAVRARKVDTEAARQTVLRLQVRATYAPHLCPVPPPPLEPLLTLWAQEELVRHAHRLGAVVDSVVQRHDTAQQLMTLLRNRTTPLLRWRPGGGGDDDPTVLPREQLRAAQVGMGRALTVTDLSLYQPPACAEACVFVHARDDCYVPDTPGTDAAWERVAAEWRGASVSEVSAGHVTGSLLLTRHYLQLISDVRDKLAALRW